MTDDILNILTIKQYQEQLKNEGKKQFVINLIHTTRFKMTKTGDVSSHD